MLGTVLRLWRHSVHFKLVWPPTVAWESGPSCHFLRVTEARLRPSDRCPRVQLQWPARNTSPSRALRRAGRRRHHSCRAGRQAELLLARGHEELLAAVAAQRVLISECPPGQAPARPSFAARSRLIAALAQGTVVVEACLHSGTLATARLARELGRPVMAVPGPVTSAHFGGCHQLIAGHDAALVTSAGDIIACLTGTSGNPSGKEGGPDRRLPHHGASLATSASAGISPAPPQRRFAGHTGFGAGTGRRAACQCTSRSRGLTR
jgi:hypothetical protein